MRLGSIFVFRTGFDRNVWCKTRCGNGNVFVSCVFVLLRHIAEKVKKGKELV